LLLHSPEPIEAKPRHVDIAAVVDEPERRLAPGAALTIGRRMNDVRHGDFPC